MLEHILDHIYYKYINRALLFQGYAVSGKAAAVTTAERIQTVKKMISYNQQQSEPTANPYHVSWDGFEYGGQHIFTSN